MCAFNYSSAGGKGSAPKFIGGRARGCGKIATQGDAQLEEGVSCYSGTLADATWRSLMVDTGGRISIGSKCSATFKALVTLATSASAQYAGFSIVGMITRDGANNTVLRASTVTVVARSRATFECQVVADDTNEALAIQIRDSAGTGDAVYAVAAVWMATVIKA
ncbi:MAG: hypothetical protein A2Y74_09960 [Actinobacteria bacterium RBG_13_63_9]|nr:MAG: hypothetical protein A2Y74_09960 [Actinobacteria bacterium RBG_13_63_9]